VTREEFFARIEPRRAELEAASVKRIGVFGSVARNEARPDSDIDVLVEFSEAPDLIDFILLKQRLEQILGTNVDLVTPNGLKARVRDTVLAEVRYAA
jgi:uncharacterized protein